jgi:hypothetical protein
MDRLYVRGLNNVHKRLLIQAAACNLALLMRSLYGAGKPRAAHDRWGQLTFAILRLYSALIAIYQSEWAVAGLLSRRNHMDGAAIIENSLAHQNRAFRHGLLDSSPNPTSELYAFPALSAGINDAMPYLRAMLSAMYWRSREDAIEYGEAALALLTEW